MKTELLTFQTTVRVRYEAKNPKARSQAVRIAREMMGELGNAHYTTDDQYNSLTAEIRRSVYRPKVENTSHYHRMGGVDR